MLRFGARCASKESAIPREQVFPLNFSLIELIEKHAKLGQAVASTQGSECEICEKTTERFCSSCPGDPILCQGCFDLTHATAKRQGHRLAGLRERGSFNCSEHQEKTKLYCHTDSKLICMMCAHFSTSHKSHSITPVPEAAAAIRGLVSQKRKTNQDQRAKIALKILQARSALQDLLVRSMQLDQQRDFLIHCASETDDSSFLLNWAKVQTLSDPPIFPNSKIFDASSDPDDGDLKTLLTWLSSAGFGERKWVLAYSGTRDGWTGAAFHSRCDNKGPTLVIAQMTAGTVFGGFAPGGWSSHNRSTYNADPTGKGFLFCMPSSLFQVAHTSYASYQIPEGGPAFGYNGHNLSFSSLKDKRACTCSSSYGYSGISGCSSFGGSCQISYCELEVFCLAA